VSDSIDLQAGCPRWLRWSHAGVSVLGLIGILAAAAPAAWSGIAIVALAAVHAGTARHMNRPASSGRLKLFADGSAVLFTVDGPVAAMQSERRWVSRWFCVLPLERRDGERSLHVIVCRSLNAPDAYRRLLQRSRLGVPDAAGRGSRVA
jgi:hypothetical protein